MRIFLTGGTGFIGSHVLQQALAAGHEVLALRRHGSKPRIQLDNQPNWLEGLMVNDWRKELHGCDALLHLASYGVSEGGDDWDGCFQVNVTDSLKLWRQAVQAGVRQFLIVGSCFEYGRSSEAFEAIPVSANLEPTTAYGASKAAASMAALALGIQYQLRLILARPFHVYGDGECSSRFWPSLVTAATSRQDLSMTYGAQVRDFQPVEQAAEQLLSCLSHREIQPGVPLVVNLGSGKATSLLQFAQKEWASLHACGKLMPGSIPYRPNEVMRYVPDIAELQQLTK
jgi:nucleoside-diphosphate-sugar epimerase